MPLRSDYDGQSCSLARALEVIGERWTMLIVRDVFFGVHRFTDLQIHLDIPRAVLSSRLSMLVDRGVLERRPCANGDGRRHEFFLTGRGLQLWPMVFGLMRWGDEHFCEHGPRRLFEHVGCGAEVDPTGRCPACGTVPSPGELVTRPAPGIAPSPREDEISAALKRPHRLLTPLRTS